MARVTVPIDQQAELFQISPEHVRISMSAAMALGLKGGRTYREAACGCINLIQNYPEGCYANCAYCGMARERPGVPEENSFIRVAWPLYTTDEVVGRIVAKEAAGEVGRVCISQVHDRRAYPDLLTILDQVRAAAPQVPVAALVSAELLDEEKLREIKAHGADTIGIGLDGATEAIFDQTRGKGAHGPHTWEGHWRIARLARDIFGPLKVNLHIIVGLGETDRDLVELFYQLRDEQIAAYLFSFNPEPGTELQHAPRAPLARHRRVQLAKFLIEDRGLARGAVSFDESGAITGIVAPADLVDAAIASGEPFMTDGCPDRHGAMTCNRPYGSYRPGEPFRDYPFVPNADDVAVIRAELGVAAITEGEIAFG
ncbi:radical SAM protein [Chloroflexales bacterium ZM16-3]|nr:radical SAM protein [Chloroflexales bacterium ZM16-3]